jgi:hypothetical protein
LKELKQLTSQQYDLEHQLNQSTQYSNSAHSQSESQQVQESNQNQSKQLLKTVKTQSKEIEALKAEIHMLSRKS